MDDLSVRVAEILAPGLVLWADSPLPDISDTDRRIASDTALEVYSGENAEFFAAACQCFYLFRLLHNMMSAYPSWSVLLGDYFFSQFSKNMIPLDSTALIDAFSRFLLEDTNGEFDRERYLRFIRGLGDSL